MIVFIFSLLSFSNIYGGLASLKDTGRYNYIKDSKNQSNLPKKVARDTLSDQERQLQVKLNKYNKDMEKLNIMLDEPLRMDKKNRIPALTTVRATLVSAILATNTDKETFYLEVSPESRWLAGARVRCIGSAKFKRIEGGCDIFRTKNNQEYFDVISKVTGLSATRGILPDYYWTNEGERFAKNSLSTFMATVLEGVKRRQLTSTAKIPRNDNADLIFGGLSQMAETASSKVGDNNQVLEIAIVNPSKAVLIHFEEGMDL